MSCEMIVCTTASFTRPLCKRAESSGHCPVAGLEAAPHIPPMLTLSRRVPPLKLRFDVLQRQPQIGHQHQRVVEQVGDLGRLTLAVLR